MTDKQALKLLLEAEVSLKKTTRGYTPAGPNWRSAMPKLWRVREGIRSATLGQELAVAHGLLKQTEHGYDPRAKRWKEAMRLIDHVEHELALPKVPQLGPVVEHGKSILLESPTHDTDGLYNSPNVPGGHNKSHYPAFDFGWQAGLNVYAPEDIEVTGQSSAMGADAFYADGESGLRYWFGHITSSPFTGKDIHKGDFVSKIAAIPGSDHGHLGIDARRLIGKDLIWGRNGNGPDYTFGAPTIGQQLAKVLEA